VIKVASFITAPKSGVAYSYTKIGQTTQTFWLVEKPVFNQLIFNSLTDFRRNPAGFLPGRGSY
jgi:hypothetical protein